MFINMHILLNINISIIVTANGIINIDMNQFRCDVIIQWSRQERDKNFNYDRIDDILQFF